MGAEALPSRGEIRQRPAPLPPGAREDRLIAYRGLGAWVDVFDRHIWRRPEATVRSLARRGVRSLFLQTGTYGLREAIRYPRATARFLEAAHARGMRVVGWYVPDFAHLRRDLNRAMAAVRFRTVRGHAFDSVALDIEATRVADDRLRVERLLRLSGRLRRRVGPRYPLGAIVPSPLRGPSFWPIFPTAALADIYDVMLPMAYWTPQRWRGEGGAFRYISESLHRLKREANGRRVPIHMIGGIARPASRSEVRGFVRAVREGKLPGASMYDVATSDEGDWAALSRLAGRLTHVQGRCSTLGACKKATVSRLSSGSADTGSPPSARRSSGK